jgi:hypothetical protein
VTISLLEVEWRVRMESLAEIMARVERLAFAQEEERQIHPDALQPLSSDEQVTLPLALPQTEMLPPPEYIQAEAFLTDGVSL